MSEDRTKHPAKVWPSNWIWQDLSDQPVAMQIIDLLHDIRLLLAFACLLLAFA